MGGQMLILLISQKSSLPVTFRGTSTAAAEYPDPPEPYAALPGVRLNQVAVHHDHCGLRGHEHRVPNNQQRGHTQQNPGAACPIITVGLAQHDAATTVVLSGHRHGGARVVARAFLVPLQLSRKAMLVAHRRHLEYGQRR